MDKAPYKVAVQVWNENYTSVRCKTPTDFFPSSPTTTNTPR